MKFERSTRGPNVTLDRFLAPTDIGVNESQGRTVVNSRDWGNGMQGQRFGDIGRFFPESSTGALVCV